MRNAAIVVLVAIAAMGMIPLDRLKGIIPDVGSIVAPDETESTIQKALDTAKAEMGPNWGIIETNARRKQFKDRQEATDRINAMLTDSVGKGVSVIGVEVKEKTQGDNWQEELANLAARYQRESKVKGK